MTTLTASRLLVIWERGLNRPLPRKTFDLLAAAYPGIDAGTCAALSIGDRDVRLLLLREHLFGSALANIAHCPQCGQPVEWQADTPGLRLQAPREETTPQLYSVQCDGYEVSFRLPNSIDIDAVLADPSRSGQPAGQLLRRCLHQASCKGRPCSPGDLPPHVLDAVSRRMEEEDPQADIRMLLNCPGCEHSWNARFDIVNYLWEEIHRWAKQMLRTVHLLAKTYHWSEADILDMNPMRRQMYLQMAQG
jgi:hypothetical protein